MMPALQHSLGRIPALLSGLTESCISALSLPTDANLPQKMSPLTCWRKPLSMAGSVVSDPKTPGRLLILVLLVFLVLGVRHLQYPGIYEDEVITESFVVKMLYPNVTDRAAYEFPPLFETATRRFPWLRGNVYGGTAMPYLSLPLYWVLGTSATSLRLVHLLYGILFLIATYAFVARFWGSWIGVATAALVATDPSFFAAFRMSEAFVPAAGIPLLLLGALLISDWYLSRRSYRAALFGGLLWGIAVWNYIVAIWFVIAACLIGTLLHACYRRMPSVKGIASIFIGLLLGYLPHYSFALAHPRVFFDKYVGFVSLRGGLLKDWVGMLSVKAGTLWSTLKGTRLAERIFRLTPEQAETEVGTSPMPYLLLAAILVIILGLVFTREKDKKLKLLVPLLFLALIGAQVALTPFAKEVHHILMLYPFPQVAVAVALALLVQALPRWFSKTSWRRLTPLAVASLVVLLGVNVQIVCGYLRLAYQTGGVGRFSDAIYALNHVLLSEYKDNRVLVGDWGFANCLLMLSRGEIKTEWMRPAKLSGLGDEFAQISVSPLQLTDPKSALLLHSSKFAGSEQRQRDVLATARVLGLTTQRTRSFYSKDGDEVYQLISFQRPKLPRGTARNARCVDFSKYEAADELRLFGFWDVFYSKISSRWMADRAGVYLDASHASKVRAKGFAPVRELGLSEQTITLSVSGMTIATQQMSSSQMFTIVGELPESMRQENPLAVEIGVEKTVIPYYSGLGPHKRKFGALIQSICVE